MKKITKLLGLIFCITVCGNAFGMSNATKKMFENITALNNLDMSSHKQRKSFETKVGNIAEKYFSGADSCLYTLGKNKKLNDALFYLPENMRLCAQKIVERKRKNRFEELKKIEFEKK